MTNLWSLTHFVYVAAKRQLPNVRTLNTLLRGCLWSAASVDANGVVCGGVVTSEKVWKLYQEKHESSDKESQNFDVSSYEYSITLLCQALRTKEAENRINEMLTFFKIGGGFEGAPQSVTEALSIAYLTLGRAHAMMGQRDEAISACSKSLDCTKSSKAALKTGTGASSEFGTYLIPLCAKRYNLSVSNLFTNSYSIR